MKNIDGDKLWAYLENISNILDNKYEQEQEKEKKCTQEELEVIYNNKKIIMAKLSFIVELQGNLLDGKFN